MKKRFRLRKFAGLTTLAALAALVTMILAGGAGAIAGAAFTTIGPSPNNNCFSGPGLVNCNLYTNKTDVWINGGPAANGLTDGSYYFAVTDPSGATLLSSDTYADRMLTVSGGEITATSGHLTYGTTTLIVQLSPYHDTPNDGGEYKAWICAATDSNGNSTVPTDGTPPGINSVCKSDNFKVRNQSECTTNCTPTPFGVTSGAKYYDRNRNGQFDTGEPGIPGWAVDFADGLANTLYTDSTGAFSVNLPVDTYTFAEEHPNSTTYPNWHQTGELNVGTQTAGQATTTGDGETVCLAAGCTTAQPSFVYSTTVVDGGTTSGLNFGNVCTLSFRSAARTMGYWANNGNSSINAADITSLQAIALVAADNGTLLNLSSTLSVAQGQIKTLINGASSTNAKNMAFMLSGQLIALVLNVNHGFLIGTDIYTPDGRTFNQIIADATTLLAGHNNTQSKSASDPGGTYRTLQGAIKNLIDTINNTNGQNLTVVPYYLDDTGGTNTGAFARCGAPSAMFLQP
jgi:hypothetical protein